MKHPNILFLMVDQMQASVLDPASPCLTPHLDRLAARGVRFERACTPNAVCSPARASLMTGLLPHNHGVLWVHHCVDADQGLLRRERPHWAQRLQEAGYSTAYFGKWHVERSESPSDFGWELDANTESRRYRDDPRRGAHPRVPDDFISARTYTTPGYEPGLFSGVTRIPPAGRPMGKIASMAGEWLDAALASSDRPWCCFVSVPEPHDPFVAGEEARGLYDRDLLKASPSWGDDLAGRPDLYRKAARVWDEMSEVEKKEAAACYYASITEIDALYGGLLRKLEQAGSLDDTVVVFTSDHGELLGAHRLYCKNIGAWEEIYRIPLVVAGPGIARGVATSARVGLHDLCPTLLELAGARPIEGLDARSFADLARDPGAAADSWQSGYGEYFGNRYLLSQRVVWEGDWKYVLNGFGIDEMYDLATDPSELRNLAEDPAHREQARSLLAVLWARVRDSGDVSLLRSHYPILRLAPFGPLIAQPAAGGDESAR